MQSRQPRPLSRPVVASGVLVGALVLALGLSRGSGAVPTASALVGVTAVLAGAWLVVRSRDVRSDGWFRLLFGLAAVVVGVGLFGVGRVGGVLGSFSLVHVLFAVSAPLLAAAALTMPRRSATPFTGARLALEALAISSSTAALLWETTFHAVLDQAVGVTGALAIALMMVDVTVAGVVLIRVVRSLDPGLALALAGLVLHVVGRVWILHSSAQGASTLPWEPFALIGAGWPLLAAGLVAFDARLPRFSSEASPQVESRGRAAVTLVSAVILGGLVVSLSRASQQLDNVSMVLLGALLATFVGREIVLAAETRYMLERIEEQARVDPLTGLDNRWALTQHLADMAHTPTVLSVLTLGLDGFKEVNRLSGPVVGDRLLAAVGRRLDEDAAPEAHVFRLGGDEFAVVSRSDSEEAMALAERLRGSVRSAAAEVCDVEQVPVMASVGVAVSPSAPQEPPDPVRALTESAMALQYAKQAGRDRVHAYSTALARADQRRADVESRLRAALQREQMDVHLQPVVSMQTGGLVGLEALARWTDPELGPVAPLEFVAVAERSGLIVDLGEAVMRQALAVGVDSGAMRAGITVGVNVSPLQLRAPGFVDSVARALVATGAPASLVVLEVTEQVFVSETDPAVLALRELKDLGVLIAIDDFGVGYSSLGYLDRLPADILKMDRSLTAHFTERRKVAVARAVVELGRGLGLKVVVEGVETAQHAEVAREVGAHFGQGWWWSAAVPGPKVRDLVIEMTGDRSSVSGTSNEVR